MKSVTEGELLQIRRHLLGQLADESERRQVEERLLLDEEYFRSVQAIEDDLVEDYVRGALSPGEREMFERHFMAAPEQRESVRQASALRNYFVGAAAVTPANTALPDQVTTSPQAAQESWWHHYVPALLRRTPNTMMNLALGSTVAAISLAVVCAAVLWRSWDGGSNRLAKQHSEQAGMHRREGELQAQLAEQQRLNEELSRAAERERQQRIELEQQLAEARARSRPADDERDATTTKSRASSPPARQETATLALMPGQTMSNGEPSSVELSPGVRALRLELIVEDDRYRSYRVELHTDEDGQIWRGDNLKARRSRMSTVVTAIIPAKLLAGKEYRVTLSGGAGVGSSDRIGTYSFSITRK